jgi:hypothetical protein
VIEWLASFGCPVVMEFVAPEDPMIQRLTANKEDEELHLGRTETEFRALLADRFSVASEQALPSGHRRVFTLRPL